MGLREEPRLGDLDPAGKRPHHGDARRVAAEDERRDHHQREPGEEIDAWRRAVDAPPVNPREDAERAERRQDQPRPQRAGRVVDLRAHL